MSLRLKKCRSKASGLICVRVMDERRSREYTGDEAKGIEAIINMYVKKAQVYVVDLQTYTVEPLYISMLCMSSDGPDLWVQLSNKFLFHLIRAQDFHLFEKGLEIVPERESLHFSIDSALSMLHQKKNNLVQLLDKINTLVQ